MAGRASEAQRAPAGRYRGARGAGRAVDVAELGAHLRDLEVRVPAPAAEQGRDEAELAQATTLFQHALARARTRRSRVVGGRPVRVVSERAVCCSLARSLDPACLVLTVPRVGRTQERRDREPSRS